MTQNSKEVVSIVIPTLNRPVPLRRALESVFHQVIPENLALEILVIDNSADCSAGWIQTDTDLASQPNRFRYISDPIPGVANARNTGLRAASGRWVAFLDDDEEASACWISEHIVTLRETKADASFGPVVARGEDGDVEKRILEFFSRSISLPDRSDITHLYAYLGTNNSVFRRDSCLAGAEVFDTSLNETGGEDSLLLRRLAVAGKRFAWSKSASVIEWVPARRTNWSYVARRRFLSGQIRTLVSHKLTPRRFGEVIFWMAAGTIQAIAWSAVSVVYSVLDKERALEARTKAWGGLGKLLWASRFRPRLYGSGLVS